MRDFIIVGRTALISMNKIWKSSKMLYCSKMQGEGGGQGCFGHNCLGAAALTRARQLRTGLSVDKEG